MFVTVYLDLGRQKRILLITMRAMARQKETQENLVRKGRSCRIILFPVRSPARGKCMKKDYQFMQIFKWQLSIAISFFTVNQGSSISGLRARIGPRRLNNRPAEQHQNAKEIYYIFFQIHFPVLTIYIFTSYQ